MFSIKDKPGALYDILQPIKKAKNKSYQTGIKAFQKKGLEYIFFVDMEDI